jgi:hypothetical protein
LRTYSALSLFYFAAGKQIIAMKEMITEKPSENRKMIRVDISKSLELLGLPLINLRRMVKH